MLDRPALYAEHSAGDQPDEAPQSGICRNYSSIYPWSWLACEMKKQTDCLKLTYWGDIVWPSEVYREVSQAQEHPKT